MWWNPHYTYFEKQYGQIIPPDTPTTHWKCIVENGCSRILYDPYRIPIIWWWGISCILFSYFGGHPPPPSRFGFSTRGGGTCIYGPYDTMIVSRERAGHQRGLTFLLQKHSIYYKRKGTKVVVAPSLPLSLCHAFSTYSWSSATIQQSKPRKRPRPLFFVPTPHEV